MKRFVVLVVILVAGHWAFCQSNSQEDPYEERLVAYFIGTPGTVVYYSMQVKAVNRLGDGAAIGVMRYLGEQSLTSPEEGTRILGLIKMAYAAPEAIRSDSDREPKATLVLLKYLSYSTISKKLQPEIEQTRGYIIKQLEEYKRQHSANKG